MIVAELIGILHSIKGPENANMMFKDNASTQIESTYISL